ncbi:LysR family transcriptional regulator [Gayadomonas joobiniege]|uniref:LysR family transcriptional regulator n=1 Tax=Gayadomonas joobiniege TaxID=1234606 RepID=UPI00038282F2|nr:LysR family transcriptional regulator [Gayadomonas joobiniege]
MSKLAKIDLNLLKTLDALLTEKSVSNAALRLFRTQSAVSHALQKLRETFSDPLLIREGREMLLTDKAKALRGPLQQILADIELLVESNQAFEPATSQRVINITAPDIFLWELSLFVQQIKALAPELTINIETHDKDPSALTSCRTDLLFANELELQSSQVEHLNCGELKWALLARKDHPISQQPNLTEWQTYSHILADHPDLTGVQANTLVKLNHDSFWATLPLLHNSDALLTCLAIAPEKYQSSLNLKVTSSPISLKKYPINAYWMADRAYRDDAMHWLIDKLKKFYTA